MHVLYEEDGAFKAATIVSDNDTSLQVETASGKRSKIKAASVLLRYGDPAPNALLDRAEVLAAGIEPDFLWECVGEGEFSFADFADEYFGHVATAVEATALLLALHSAPIYFHRKGKGRFRKAPPEILQAALAGLERKRQQALTIERMVRELKAFSLPPEFSPMLGQLLYKPDRNRSETKALEAACAESGLSAAHLLQRCGAIRSAHDYHLQRFLLEQFPRGTAFPATVAMAQPGSLPRADVRAFSIDDATTTEIDDAFSLQPLPGVGWRVGIHIAAPSLGIAPGSPLDAIARERLSTVYLPGSKITMLPDSLLDQFTLAGGRDCPAVSLYLTVSQEFEITAHESRVEIVPVVANLRHHDIEPLFNERTIADGLLDFAWRDELITLWQFANACEGRRGKPSAMQGNFDYNFRIDGDIGNAEGCRVEISLRKRGSPLDKLVAELMIVANSTWGGLLAEQGIAAIYRVQTGGKVRMSTSPQAHEGLGVKQYAWSSSPLRRYVDLINQWQLVACLRGETPPFAARSEALFAALRDFELTYGAYIEFQRSMERYWCLRWLRQQGIETIDATVGRDNLARLDQLPLAQRLPSAPELKPGQRVLLRIESIDYLTLSLGCRYLETLAPETANGGGDDEMLEALD
ncbi:MAG TPA: RNB domain-containing ribonuclease [Accumulibacter sp.]|uniref:ribonuclease catalytic domain-containing protein n=1 Tax=Accumulibacter sp. TaxID=2053492 RepID=UPI0025F2F467|nr:RNB domain-containing ribonuclease [Accumulibacter sp.]MCM8597872.1 RNB domain-containing ribonuclease [Accumulibacter sp.]MCM8663358.1 RNB domain-containing ribonuclease [Accumulibacter sp.]HNC50668.1 RNB domain-containing ribonuclease [Accumulibacter sp.]